MEEEKRQRRNFEKASLLLLFLSLVLLAVVAAGALRYGSVASQRDSEQARAQSNGTAAKGLASRVKQACTQGGQESVRLHHSGLCVDAQRVERSVQGVPGPAGVRGPQGPAGVDGVDGSAGRVCLARPVCAARKALQVWMVLMVRLGWLALLVRRVPRV
ncbi:tail fiber protein [Cutibacterium phage PAVL21]|nr:tail fiber protein [Cutibacterium phage PAVL21]